MKHKNLRFIRRPARRNIKKIMKALREHGCVGIYRQMHFGVAFYVVPTDGVCRTPCLQNLTSAKSCPRYTRSGTTWCPTSPERSKYTGADTGCSRGTPCCAV